MGISGLFQGVYTVRMSERIIFRTGEALVEADNRGPQPSRRSSSANSTARSARRWRSTGGTGQGAHGVFALLNSDVQVKPATLMVSKVTVKSTRTPTSSWAPCRRRSPTVCSTRSAAGDIPRDRVNDSASSAPSGSTRRSSTSDDSTRRCCSDAPRGEAGLTKAMRNEPTIDWLLENQDKVVHYFHQLAVDEKDGATSE